MRENVNARDGRDAEESCHINEKNGRKSRGKAEGFSGGLWIILFLVLGIAGLVIGLIHFQKESPSGGSEDMPPLLLVRESETVSTQMLHKIISMDIPFSTKTGCLGRIVNIKPKRISCAGNRVMAVLTGDVEPNEIFTGASIRLTFGLKPGGSAILADNPTVDRARLYGQSQDDECDLLAEPDKIVPLLLGNLTPYIDTHTAGHRVLAVRLTTEDKMEIEVTE